MLFGLGVTINPSIHVSIFLEKKNNHRCPKDVHQLHPQSQLQLPFKKGYALFCWEGKLCHNQIKNPHSFFEGSEGGHCIFWEEEKSAQNSRYNHVPNTLLCQAAIEEGDYAVFSVAFLLMSVSKEPLTTFNHSKVIEGLCISSLLHSGKNKHSPLPIRKTSTNGGFSIAMLDYQSSGYIIHKRQWHEHIMAITRGIWTQEPLCRNSEFPWSHCVQIALWHSEYSSFFEEKVKL